MSDMNLNYFNRRSSDPVVLRVFPVMMLSSVLAVIFLLRMGYYLGRFLRWNSWNMLINPVDVLEDSLHIIIHPFENIQFLGFTLIFSLFLIVSYLTLLVLIRPDEKGS